MDIFTNSVKLWLTPKSLEFVLLFFFPWKKGLTVYVKCWFKKPYKFWVEHKVNMGLTYIALLVDIIQIVWHLKGEKL